VIFGLLLLLLVLVASPGVGWGQAAEAPARLEPVVVTPGRIEQQAGEAPASITVITEGNYFDTAGPGSSAAASASPTDKPEILGEPLPVLPGRVPTATGFREPLMRYQPRPQAVGCVPK